MAQLRVRLWIASDHNGRVWLEDTTVVLIYPGTASVTNQLGERDTSSSNCHCLICHKRS